MWPCPVEGGRYLGVWADLLGTQTPRPPGPMRCFQNIRTPRRDGSLYAPLWRHLTFTYTITLLLALRGPQARIFAYRRLL